MDLHRLRYFIAVAETGSTHRAADRVLISQPAVARQVRLLEEELAIRLFERDGRGMRLTDAGKSFLADARKLIEAADRARHKAALIDEGFTGSLRLGFHEIAHRYPEFRRILGRFREAHPDIDYVVTVCSSQVQLDLLRKGELDVGFLFLWDRPAADLRTMRIRSDDYLLVLPESHPLSRDAEIDGRSLRGERFVWVDRQQNAVQSQLLIAACANAGFSPRVAYEGLSSEMAMVSLVAAGLGLAILPASLAEEAPRGVVLRRIRDFAVGVELHLVWRPEAVTGALARFIGLARG